ncbi:folate/biopterin family MFS transporter [Dolichospermum sp. ST_sed1]|nr:folate/biopterin family MFS transporter [Dolichospermum sp. ST_sed1]MDD1424410.1 folate/biopterin family MFS transporter [Dolichospermum sp. ST_sed9]MDD1433952.1 folate/biopterin family MFS transporter [Dolichospermum sp. ST_sed6]MDD1441059.1 folate/biopterin family MFS transporter [Dolichospermum sp. ST_sed3]MDD1448944.1 folate/biopterin family MFS transporter [Dolichospermum sp. ST_sed8]MDD1457537.1 folate/biopterin family MFS transporter [Dolichospermum sp. ST_sed7]MDD1460951.1 folate/b
MLNDFSSSSKIKDFLTQKILLGNEPSAELIVIITIYFVQGILTLSRLAVSFFLKDELLLSPVQMSAIIGIGSLPWMIKPLYGFISDSLPLFGYHRKPYLVLSGIIGCAAWVCLGTVVHTSSTATIMIVLSSLSVAISDVIVDSIVVERARSESDAKTGSLQSLCWGSSAIGALCTAYFSGLLLEYFTTRTVFLVTASFPLIVSSVAWFIAEQPIDKDVKKSNNTKNQLLQIRQAITQKVIWLPTLFIFIWQATPNADSAFFYFTTNELHFQPEFLGRVRLVTSFASLLGVWAFQRYFKTVPFRIIFSWGIFVSTALGMTTLLLVTHTNRLLGIDDHWFSLGDSLILTVIGQVIFMPVLVLSTRLCPPGIEATFFAVLMSVMNFGGTVSYWLGSLMMKWLGITEYQFDSLWLLIIITNCTSLIPILFMKWLPDAQVDIDNNVIS